MFHVSSNFLGNEWVAYPRIPDRAMEGEDKVTPRICVSPSIKGCLLAIDGIKSLGLSGVLADESGWFIYKTEAKAIDASNFVPDAYLTEECWITDSCRFKLAGQVMPSSDHKSIIVLWGDGSREVLYTKSS